MAKRNEQNVERQCMPCTACCDGWVRMTVYGHEIYPGKPCPFSTGESCQIYPRRPTDPCINFNCAWIIADSPLPDWFRPDKAKTIVLHDMLVWNGLSVDVAVPVGKRIPGRALNWLKQRSMRAQRPLIYTEQVLTPEGMQKDQQVYAFGNEAFQHDIADAVSSGKRLW